ncbi:MAG: hypothetical protein Q9207_001781 [Kuettlingeria erythrocarpa]
MAGPSEPSLNGTEDQNDRQAELETLVAQATSKYSVKDYDAAAELYSQATEIQAEINGEMAAKNADLLYAYGRCLYHAAVRNSDVLGSKVAGEKQQARSDKPSKHNGEKYHSPGSGPGTTGSSAMTEEGFAQIAGDSGGSTKSEAAQNQAAKPYFQFTGDENFEGSDGEADAQQPDGDPDEAAEEEDDFANAFEVLDLARVLLLKRLEEEQGETDYRSIANQNNAETVRQLKERLADTHDLQAEISLEGERFPNAVDDLRAALELKKKLFPEESSLIAEAHYKLSLALEFSSVTEQKTPDGGGDGEEGSHVDEAMREESGKEMEAAIASCKIRISKEEAKLQARETATEDQKKETMGSGKGKNMTRRDIDDVKEMVGDMEQRLIELRQSPIAINDAASGGNGDGTIPLGGFLGSILGESPAAQREKLNEASKGATDLSNLVKRKKPSVNAVSGEAEDDTTAGSGGKRKVEFVEEVVEVGTGKKAKLSNGNEEEA